MQPCPSYRKLMSHVGCVTYTPCFDPPIYLSACPRHFFFFSFTLYENARELHKYTREQKKKGAGGEGTGFDGELDNFQGPTLSSLSKLVRLGCNFLPLIHTDLLFGQNMDDIFRL